MGGYAQRVSARPLFAEGSRTAFPAGAAKVPQARREPAPALPSEISREITIGEIFVEMGKSEAQRGALGSQTGSLIAAIPPSPRRQGRFL